MAATITDKRALNRLKAGSTYFGCGRYLKSLEEIHRQEIYVHYEHERFNRKYDDIMKCYYQEAGENWNQTLFSYFFQYIGDPVNKALYKQVARRVGYNAILRERNNPMRVEALLLGASGLLKDYSQDSYTQELQKEAAYLIHKYDITPLSSTDWNLRKLHPKNNPVLRLAQAASLFVHNELLFDKVIRCRCIEDIEEIFSVEASDYWTTHYVPAKVSVGEVKRIGGSKCNVIGINLVVMIQHAYGAYTSDEALLNQSWDLIQNLKPEINWVVNRWRNYGLRPKTAFEGQALLQLGKEYCMQARCEECFVGQRAAKDFSWLDKYEDELDEF